MTSPKLSLLYLSIKDLVVRHYLYYDTQIFDAVSEQRHKILINIINFCHIIKNRFLSLFFASCSLVLNLLLITSSS